MKKKLSSLNKMFLNLNNIEIMNEIRINNKIFVLLNLIDIKKFNTSKLKNKEKMQINEDLFEEKKEIIIKI